MTTRGRRPRGRQARRLLPGRRDRVFPGGVPRSHGRQRVVTGVGSGQGARRGVRRCDLVGIGSAPRPPARPVEPVVVVPTVTRAVASAEVDVVDVLVLIEENRPSFPEQVSESSSLAVPPLASPVPAGPPAGPRMELAGEELRVLFGDRRWRVRGLAKVTSFDLLRLNVLVARDDERLGSCSMSTRSISTRHGRGVCSEGGGGGAGAGRGGRYPGSRPGAVGV